MKTTASIATICTIAFLAVGNTQVAANPGPLEKYQKDIKSILTEDRLRQVVDPGSNDVNVARQESGDSLSVSWTWPSDRMLVTDLGFTKIETSESNQLSVSQFRLLTNAQHGPKNGKDYVERNYRSVSAEEMEQIQKNMQAALQERVEKGEITAEQAKIAGGVGGTVSGKERLVESIDGIGDACRWVQNDSTLVLGVGDVFLAVYSKISADDAINRDAAIKLAKLITGN